MHRLSVTGCAKVQDTYAVHLLVGIISIGLITCVSCAYWITLGCAGNTATLRRFSEFSWFLASVFPVCVSSRQIFGADRRGHAEAVHHSFIGAPLLDWRSGKVDGVNEE